MDGGGWLKPTPGLVRAACFLDSEADCGLQDLCCEPCFGYLGLPFFWPDPSFCLLEGKGEESEMVNRARFNVEGSSEPNSCNPPSSKISNSEGNIAVGALPKAKKGTGYVPLWVSFFLHFRAPFKKSPTPIHRPVQGERREGDGGWMGQRDRLGPPPQEPKYKSSISYFQVIEKKEQENGKKPLRREGPRSSPTRTTEIKLITVVIEKDLAGCLCPVPPGMCAGVPAHAQGPGHENPC